MPLFQRLSQRFWDYVSPRKTQARRDKPFKAKVTPLSTKPTPRKHGRKPVRSSLGRSMSPDTRIDNWQLGTPPLIQRSSNPGERLMLTPATSRTADLQTPGLDFEGDTLIDDLGSPSVHQDSTLNVNDETIVVTEKRYEGFKQKTFDRESVLEKHAEQARSMRAEGWTEDAIELVQKFQMRGFEPLMPKSWELDFSTLPSELFTANNEEAFIKSVVGKDFRATKALNALIGLGPRVRDALETKNPFRPPEQVILRALESYLKWSYDDGGLSFATIPILVLEAGSSEMSTEEIGKNMLAKLGNLRDYYADAFRIHSSVESADGSQSFEPPSEAFSHELPTLYGIVMASTLMAFVAYDCYTPEPELHMMGMFNYKQSDYDVWNSLAAAILVVHCRNKTMELKNDMTSMAELGSAMFTADDPDA
ncbi:hypothetical protein W97_00012 [Coniosporium apollinis CBS 100218]|uniref:Uncharacterized protein n=1 Tax=Coniosporium apollinis (strain CBS 100218) TaxID=1168221 RepID=R7YFZ4_CONA1|nr:uncharacterized protein W97_00012 [Coniosporium apollinis CBS 100218]EON60803.1 hypothetical protein W97_00012 [Coniosporium apollinis CBS 100218]